MNKPSERIVVFVSPAQKRAIATTAEELGISVSELMRRAVLNFGATSEQIKAASIVDRLRAPREPDALNAALQRVARSAKANRDTLPPALRNASAATHDARDHAHDPHRDSVPQAPLQPARQPLSAHVPVSVAPVATPVPVDPLQAFAAIASEAAEADSPVDEAVRAAEAQAAVDAAARVAAAKAATLKVAKPSSKSKPAAGTSSRDENPFIDPTKGSGRFA